MTNEEISKLCDENYKQIKDAEDKLIIIRSDCKHEDTFEGLWSYRPGSAYPAIICRYCGAVVEMSI